MEASQPCVNRLRVSNWWRQRCSEEMLSGVWYNRERDALIALGTSKFLIERLLEMSDLYETEICNECGNIATSKYGCQACATDDVSRVRMPYANKILLYMLQGMGLKVGLTAKE